MRLRQHAGDDAPSASHVSANPFVDAVVRWTWERISRSKDQLNGGESLNIPGTEHMTAQQVWAVVPEIYAQILAKDTDQDPFRQILEHDPVGRTSRAFYRVPLSPGLPVVILIGWTRNDRIDTDDIYPVSMTDKLRFVVAPDQFTRVRMFHSRVTTNTFSLIQSEFPVPPHCATCGKPRRPAPGC